MAEAIANNNISSVADATFGRWANRFATRPRLDERCCSSLPFVFGLNPRAQKSTGLAILRLTGLGHPRAMYAYVPVLSANDNVLIKFVAYLRISDKKGLIPKRFPPPHVT